jgi:hypothetical protein
VFNTGLLPNKKTFNYLEFYSKIISNYQSTYCFCGNSYGLYGKSNFCTLPCGGNASETCGGDYVGSKFANNVYLTSLSNLLLYIYFFI